MGRVGEDAAAAVVHDDDVDLLALDRTLVVGGVGGGMLSGGGAGEQAGVQGEGVVVGDDLLEAHDGDVELGKRGTHVGVALVGADCECSRGGHCEVDSGHGGVGVQEFLPQMLSGGVGEVGRVAVAVLCT